MIAGCSAAFAGGTYWRGATAGQAAFAGLFIALASSSLLVVVLAVLSAGRATRRDA